MRSSSVICTHWNPHLQRARVGGWQGRDFVERETKAPGIRASCSSRESTDSSIVYVSTTHSCSIRARSPISLALSHRNTHHAGNVMILTRLLSFLSDRTYQTPRKSLTLPTRKKISEIGGSRPSPRPFTLFYRLLTFWRSSLDGFSAFRRRMRRVNPIEFRGIWETAGPFDDEGDLRDPHLPIIIT